MSGLVDDVNEQGFDQALASSKVPVVVDFWAPWCGPCKMVGPVLEKLANEHSGKVKVVKVNVDENQALAAKFGIMSIPTVIMFEQGQVKHQLVGARGQRDYEREFGLA